MNTRKKITRKLNSSSAFSLAETLVAILIMLMVSAIVAGGIPAARNAYEKIMKAADAEVMMSTAISTLRNELGTATKVKAASNSLIYFSEAVEASSRISKGKYDFTKGKLSGKSEETIKYQKYAKTFEEQETESTPVLLISEEASGGDLYVSYDDVDYKNGIVTFKNLNVYDEKDDKVTGRNTLSIRVMSHKES